MISEYMQTPTKNVPEDWNVAELETVVVESKTGVPVRKQDRKPGPYPYFGANGIIDNVHDYICDGEYVIVAQDGSIGSINYFNGKFWPNNHVWVIRFDSTVSAYFMHYLLQTLNWQRLAVGSTRPKITQQILLSIDIPIPPLAEQRRIAEVLSSVDNAIQKVDEAIAKTERLKKGLMQKLLTEGIGHKEFKETQIGKIPKEWKVVKLTDIVEKKSDIIAGPFGSNLKVCDYRPSGVPIIRLQNIERNQFIQKDIKYTSSEKAEELSYHSYQPGDIVLAKLGDPIGKTCIVPSFVKAGIVVADVVRIRPSPKKAVTLFLEYVLNSSMCFYQLRKQTIGSTRPRVNISQVRNLRIPLPPLDEQQRIADVLSAIDYKFELERSRKGKLERIKKGLMNDLLSGKVRVKVD